MQKKILSYAAGALLVLGLSSYDYLQVDTKTTPITTTPIELGKNKPDDVFYISLKAGVSVGLDGKPKVELAAASGRRTKCKSGGSGCNATSCK